MADNKLLVEVNYLGPMPEGRKPYTMTFDPKDGTPLADCPLDVRKVPIVDVRGKWDVDNSLEEAPSFMDDGTELVRGVGWLADRLSPEDFEDKEKMAEVYHPRLVELLRQIIEKSGKRKMTSAEVFDTTVRERTVLDESVTEAPPTLHAREHAPLARVHGDYSSNSGPRRVRTYAPERADEILASGNWAIVNVWRPIKGPIFDSPLVFLDPKTANPERDFVLHDLVYPHVRGEILAVKHDPSHRFFYISEQTPDEAWVFKTFDGKKKLNGIMVHTGADEPNEKVLAKFDGRGRHSVEVRILVIWQDVLEETPTDKQAADEQSATPRVLGVDVDPETRCAHYHLPIDVIALKFACCEEYYPCYQCHAAVADHKPQRWPKERFGEPAVLCGVCKTELTVDQYMMSAYYCPSCDTAFNPGCSLHAHIYFEVEEKPKDSCVKP